MYLYIRQIELIYLNLSLLYMSVLEGESVIWAYVIYGLVDQYMLSC